MCKIAGADKVQSFHFCESSDLLDTNPLASGSAKAAVNVQISDNSHILGQLGGMRNDRLRFLQTRSNLLAGMLEPDSLAARLSSLAHVIF
jgi:hypothetical protein